MVTGHRAFQGDSRMSTITAILRDEPKSLSEAAAEQTPRELERIITRCLRKDPARRFQHVGDVKLALEDLKEESESGHWTETPRAAKTSRTALVFAALAVAIALAAALWLGRRLQAPAGSRPELSLRQITQDTGLTGYPAISLDGKLLAYASDRAGDGGLDIWVQQLSRGAQPIRLTRHVADDLSPSFSPDGGQIVFASGRDGGGVYVMPALGGEERLLMRGSLHEPRFSPDGKLVVAYSGAGFSRTLQVVAASGGPVRRIAESFYSATSPVWSPDGKRILFEGAQEMGQRSDWWIAPLEGGPAVPTGAAAVLPTGPAGFLPRPAEWLGNSVLYSSGNLWRLNVATETGKVDSKPVRLTTGAANEAEPRATAAPGAGDSWRIVFTATSETAGLWSLALNDRTGRPAGEPVKLIRDALRRTTPSLSADGARLAYVYRGLDGYGVRVRDLKTAAETTVLQSPNDVRARLSPYGSVVAYNLTTGQRETTIHLVPSSGGESRKLCDTCGLIYDWTPDGKKIIYRSGQPIRFSVVDVGTGRSEVILADPKHDFHGAKYSPDGRWLAFFFAPEVGRRPIFIAPAREGKAAPESEWIPIMDRPGVHRRAWWSATGNVLYYLSTAGGRVAIWSQRLDPATKRPVGEPVQVYAPAGERLLLGTAHPFGPAELPNRVVFPINERGGNIWIAE